MRCILIIISLLFLLNPTTSLSQAKILVAEGKVKVSGLSEENFFYGFAPGDKLIFNLHIEGGKELKEFEIIEYPSASRFKEFKVSSVQNKTITSIHESVFKFRFYNGKLGKRVCSYSIYRIPASEEFVNFNTTVEWILKTDTTWKTYTRNVVVSHDTSYIKQLKKEEVSRTINEVLIIDKIERVHSKTNSNGNRTWMHFTLPQNHETEKKVTSVVAWAYWVGVGEDANAAWSENSKTVVNLAKRGAAAFATPLGALAIGVVAELIIPKIGEDVLYILTDQENKNLFMGDKNFSFWDRGKGVAGYKKILDPRMCQGTYYLCFSNDNIMQGIDANVKVSAIIETVSFDYVEKEVPIIKPIVEKKIFREPEIDTYSIPVITKN